MGRSAEYNPQVVTPEYFGKGRVGMGMGCLDDKR